jgi:hypothetical protein
VTAPLEASIMYTIDIITGNNGRTLLQGFTFKQGQSRKTNILVVPLLLLTLVSFGVLDEPLIDEPI